MNARRCLPLTALCLAFTATTALADGDPSTDGVPRMLPYQGQLEVDGRPLNASGDDALHILFSLYDGPEAEQPTYRQQIAVEVYAGRFTATIGPVGFGPDDAERAIADVIAAADDLYLGMTLLGDPEDPEDDIALSNRQRIMATPYAMWTTSATDLSVARDLIVGGDVQVQGNVDVAGDLAVGGAVVLPAEALTGREVADASLGLADLNAGEVVGNGLRVQGASMAVDDAYIDSRVRSWVRSNCSVQLGWRDACSNCGSGPAKHVTVRADGVCTGAVGGDTRCRANNTWGGVNTDGTVDGNDVFYVRLVCN